MIKLFFTDLDGCLTDGGYYTFEDGYLAKKFYCRDFHGFSLLDSVGIKCGIVSTASDVCIEHRISALPFQFLGHFKVKDKYNFVKSQYIDTGQYKWEDISYIGDDVFDIRLLKHVGIAACPQDADPQVLKYVENRADGYVLSSKGGQGCVRELCNIVLNSIT